MNPGYLFPCTPFVDAVVAKPAAAAAAVVVVKDIKDKDPEGLNLVKVSIHALPGSNTLVPRL